MTAVRLRLRAGRRGSDETQRPSAARPQRAALLALPVLAICGVALTGCTSSGSNSPSASPSAAGPSLAIPSAASSARSATATATLPAQASTPVPVPGSTRPTAKVTTASPVPFRSKASLGGGISVSIASVSAVTAKSTGLPGEISGPAVAASVVVRNGSSHPVALTDVFVDLAGSAGTPGTPITGNGSKPFTGSLRAGHSATGHYVFTIAKAEQTKLTVSVSYSQSTTVVVFTGTSK